MQATAAQCRVTVAVGIKAASWAWVTLTRLLCGALHFILIHLGWWISESPGACVCCLAIHKWCPCVCPSSLATQKQIASWRWEMQRAGPQGAGLTKCNVLNKIPQSWQKQVCILAAYLSMDIDWMPGYWCRQHSMMFPGHVCMLSFIKSVLLKISLAKSIIF